MDCAHHFASTSSHSLQASVRNSELAFPAFAHPKARSSSTPGDGCSYLAVGAKMISNSCTQSASMTNNCGNNRYQYCICRIVSHSTHTVEYVPPLIFFGGAWHVHCSCHLVDPFGASVDEGGPLPAEEDAISSFLLSNASSQP